MTKMPLTTGFSDSIIFLSLLFFDLLLKKIIDSIIKKIMDRWCSWLTHRPVTAKIAGSSPVRSAMNQLITSLSIDSWLAKKTRLARVFLIVVRDDKSYLIYTELKNC